MHLLLLSLILLLLGFPPFYLGFLPWLALIPLIYYCQTTSPRRAWWSGFCLGFLFQLGVHYYLYTSFRFVLPPLLSLLALAAMSVVLALYIGLFCAFISYTYKKLPTNLYLVVVPSAWVALEYTRSLGLLGHTGGFLGYTQVPYTFLLQPASFYGIWGISFMMVLFQSLLLRWWQCKKEEKNHHHGRPVGITLGLLVFIAVGLFLPGVFPIQQENNPYRLLLVQGNIPQEQVLHTPSAPGNFQQYLDLTTKGYQTYDNLDLIIWPETVLSSSLLRQKPGAPAEVADLTKTLDVPLLTGAMFQDEKDIFNSIFLFEDGVLLPERYDKKRLVPFAEYFPFPFLLNRFARTNLNLGTYAPAEERHLFSIGETPVAGVICFESYFGDYTRTFVNRGALHLFVLSNDAWFKQTTGVNQHADAAAVRAVEMGIGVTQVANTGYTVSYNYRGEELLRSSLEKAEVLLLEDSFKRRTTIYSLAGDFLPGLCFIFLGYNMLLISKESYKVNMKK